MVRPKRLPLESIERPINMRNFRELKVWEKSHSLALAVYKATEKFPKDEIYGLTSQIPRCGVSVPANIAEGCGRSTKTDFARFLQISTGRFQWDQPVNWNTTFCRPMTLT